MAHTTTSPIPSRVLMIATYVVGFIGAYFGFQSLSSGSGLALSAILSVGVTGIISFVRHAIYNRSDAVNGGWDYGAVNNFQIEVGLANLAWGVFAILAVVLNWGQKAVAASFLISGFYFASVALFIIVTRDFKNRKIGGLIGITIWAVVMIWIGWGAMTQGSV
jgi:hypothetical protein